MSLQSSGDEPRDSLTGKRRGELNQLVRIQRFTLWRWTCFFFSEDACAKYLGANLNKHPRLKIFDTCVLVVFYNIYLGMIRGGCLVAQSEMPLISLHLCPGIAALAQALVEVRLFTVKIFLCCHFPTFFPCRLNFEGRESQALLDGSNMQRP